MRVVGTPEIVRVTHVDFGEHADKSLNLIVTESDLDKIDDSVDNYS